MSGGSEAMNDYVAGLLARERQADYMREIAHDELAALVHRASEADAPAGDGPPVEHSAQLRLRGLLGRLAPSRLAARGDRP